MALHRGARRARSAPLRAYRSGARKQQVMAVLVVMAVMAVMAKLRNDEDIHHLAVWFAAMRVETSAPK